MSWRLARSLETLQGELDARHPDRLTPDWTIGDEDHASRDSRHNPNRHGVVTAIDVRQSPALDVHRLADRLTTHPHPELAYIISNRRIAGRFNGWEWRKHRGHTDHIHIAVGQGPDSDPRPPYDSTRPWLAPAHNEEEAMTVPLRWIGRGGDRTPVALVFSDGHKIEVARSDTDAAARALGETFGVPFIEADAAKSPDSAYDAIPSVT